MGINNIIGKFMAKATLDNGMIIAEGVFESSSEAQDAIGYWYRDLEPTGLGKITYHLKEVE